jgi:hypothetical protein
MAELKTAFAPRALGRFTLTAIMAALVLYLARLFAERVFLAATGFLPFDLQFPLRAQTIAIQLGAYANSSTAKFYSAFALIDGMFAVATAGALTLSWLWIATRQPNPFFAFLNRAGIVLVPLVAGVLDVAENFGFDRLMHGLKGISYSNTIEITATVHQVKAALIYVRDFLTLLVVTIALILLWLRRWQRKASA